MRQSWRRPNTVLLSEGVQEVEYGKRATLWQGSDRECEKPGHTDLESFPVAPWLVWDPTVAPSYTALGLNSTFQPSWKDAQNRPQWFRQKFNCTKFNNGQLSPSPNTQLKKMCFVALQKQCGEWNYSRPQPVEHNPNKCHNMIGSGHCGGCHVCLVRGEWYIAANRRLAVIEKTKQQQPEPQRLAALSCMHYSGLM